MAMAHHLTDLASKHSTCRRRKPTSAIRSAITLLTAAKIPQAAQQTLHTAHQTNATAVGTNRLMKTPIHANATPQPPGGAP